MDGMPLAFTQEGFLVLGSVNTSLHLIIMSAVLNMDSYLSGGGSALSDMRALPMQ